MSESYYPKEPKMVEFDEIQRAVHTLSVEKGWYEGVVKNDPAVTQQKLLLVHSEISEAVEELRNGRDPTEVYYNEGSKKPEGFPIEMADAVIRIMDVCEANGIDLESAIMLKHAYNKTRPHRHGGKKF